jgi:inner membrane transporter RhtA
VLRRMGQRSFALLLALLPVTATAIGLAVLRQVPTLPEAFGILAVVIGLTIRTREGEPGPGPL